MLLVAKKQARSSDRSSEKILLSSCLDSNATCHRLAVQPSSGAIADFHWNFLLFVVTGVTPLRGQCKLWVVCVRSSRRIAKFFLRSRWRVFRCTELPIMGIAYRAKLPLLLEIAASARPQVGIANRSRFQRRPSRGTRPSLEQLRAMCKSVIG